MKVHVSSVQGLEHLKIETRLIDERFQLRFTIVMGQCVI